MKKLFFNEKDSEPEAVRLFPCSEWVQLEIREFENEIANKIVEKQRIVEICEEKNLL